MTYGPAEILTVDLHFENQNDMKLAFKKLSDYLKGGPNPDEINIRVHWRKQHLNPSHLADFRHQIAELVKSNTFLNIICTIPACFNDPMKLATFPDCKSCIYLESQHCFWPRQFETQYYLSPQSDLQTLNIEKAMFESSKPLTWFYPQRKIISLLSKLFELTEVVIDFGCGNGFIDSLLLKETSKLKIIGVDPFVKPNLNDKRFNYQKTFHPIKEPHSVLSCLADYNVPVERLFLNSLPELVAFVVFPKVFGRGGLKKQIHLTSQALNIITEQEIFDLKLMQNMGYQSAFKKDIESFFYSDCYLEVFTTDHLLTSAQEIISQFKEPSPYNWEDDFLKKSENKNSEISTFSLS